MFSPYVVVPDRRRTGDGGAKTVGEQGGADLVVIIATGHLGNGLDVADVFGDEHEHHRNEHRQNREVNLRQVESRQTNQAASPMAEKSTWPRMQAYA